MKMRVKHFLFLAGAAIAGYYLYKTLPKPGMAGMGESNPLVGQPQWFNYKRRMHSWASTPVSNRTRKAPLYALDDVRSPAIARYMITDAGLGRW